MIKKLFFLFLILEFCVVSRAQNKLDLKVIREIKMLNPAFECLEEGYTVFINSTRSKCGVNQLYKNKNLDSISFMRCLRLVGIIQNNPTKFVFTTGRRDGVFSMEGHREKIEGTEENVSCSIWGINVPYKKFEGLDLEKISSILKSHYAWTNLEPIGLAYNSSQVHLKNRTDPRWKEYGSSIILTVVPVENVNYVKGEFAPKFMNKIVVVGYEVFR